MHPQETVKALIRDQVSNLPMWAVRWPGGFLGLVANAHKFLKELAEKTGHDPRTVQLVDGAEIVREIYREMGLSLSWKIRVVTPQGEHIPLGILKGGQVV